MIALLDPLMFDRRDPIGLDRLDLIVAFMRQMRLRVPGVDWYWKPLQRTLIGPLSKQRPEYGRSLDRIREFATDIAFPNLPRRVPVWSFRQMFQPLGDNWVKIMARLTAGMAVRGEPSILVTYLRLGRNAEQLTGPGRCVLTRKTCWNLRVRLPGAALVQVPVVCSRRNLDVPWTCRFDDRLPATDDDAEFPFCPPPGWEKVRRDPNTGDIRHHDETHASRPAWRDDKGNYWARPATGGGYHWDVYLETALETEYGLGQLNIVQWGAPAVEGDAGSLHHVPATKHGRLRKRTGWTC